MKLKRLHALHSLIVNNAVKLISSKGHDYSHMEDTLSNFKTQAIICDALHLDNSPKAQAMRLVVVKLIRIANLWKKDTPKNESIIDSVTDAINYLILAEACRLDELKIDDVLVAAEVEENHAL